MAEPPLVITRVLDGEGAVLADRLAEAAPPTVESISQGQWRTEYVFELPGSLYQAGNRIVHVIDPDNEMAETDEGDNVGETITLYGETPPQFRITFVPLVHVTDTEAPPAEAEALMAGSRALLPIADDFEAAVRAPLTSGASGKFELLDEIRALWNAEADADEFYHGVFRAPWPGDGVTGALGGGVADQTGRVGVSQVSAHRVIPHELGHNLNLRHTPGCGAGGVDDAYPYADGGLGPNPGWELNWRRFVSSDHEGYADVMSSCRRDSFVSDYHYGRALEYWLSKASDADASLLLPFAQVEGASQQGAGSSNLAPASPGEANDSSIEEGGLALSGRIDGSGVWSLTHAQKTEKGPRPPSVDGAFTLVLFDSNGVEVYREPLSLIRFSEGGEGGWAARTPRPVRAVQRVSILDSQGVVVLKEELLTME